MSRLDEVRKEIEQICDEIEQDALHSRHDAAISHGSESVRPVCIHLIVSGEVSHMYLDISFQHDDDHDHH